MRKHPTTPDPDTLLRTRRRARRASTLPRDPIREWWKEPVAGWPDWLTIRNLKTGKETTIKIRDRRDDHDHDE
jgi:hypothetical protein